MSQLTAKEQARALWMKKYFAAHPGAKSVTRTELVAFYKATIVAEQLLGAPAPAAVEVTVVSTLDRKPRKKRAAQPAVAALR